MDALAKVEVEGFAQREARTCFSPCQLLGWEAGELKDRSIGHFEERTARQLDVIWL